MLQIGRDLFRRFVQACGGRNMPANKLLGREVSALSLVDLMSSLRDTCCQRLSLLPISLSAGAKRDFALGQKLPKYEIKLARCLFLSVAGFDQTLWRPPCRETAPVSTARVVRGVSPGVPQWGAPMGAELLTAQNTGVPNTTLRSAPWSALRGRLGTLRLGNSVNMPMPSVLAI